MMKLYLAELKNMASDVMNGKTMTDIRNDFDSLINDIK